MFKNYRKTSVQSMRPYITGEDLTDISVSNEDAPTKGGMVAINPSNPDDMWYISPEFFNANYEEVS